MLTDTVVYVSATVVPIWATPGVQIRPVCKISAVFLVKGCLKDSRLEVHLIVVAQVDGRRKICGADHEGIDFLDDRVEDETVGFAGRRRLSRELPGDQIFPNGLDLACHARFEL